MFSVATNGTVTELITMYTLVFTPRVIQVSSTGTATVRTTMDYRANAVLVTV